MSVDWGYYDKFDDVMEKYLPERGEGNTMATQVVTAVTKLVYKWYNDGDVYDNVHGPMRGWCNNLSSYANWLALNDPAAREILPGIRDCRSDSSYEDLLKRLTDELFEMRNLEELDKIPANGSIYDCDGPYEFDEHWDDEDEEDIWGEEEEDDEEVEETDW